MPIWSAFFRTFQDHYCVDEEFDDMATELLTVPYLDELHQMDDSYPGMSELEVMVIADMYSGFIDPLVDWWTLKPREKEELSKAYWLQYLDDTAEVYV